MVTLNTKDEDSLKKAFQAKDVKSPKVFFGGVNLFSKESGSIAIGVILSREACVDKLS